LLAVPDERYPFRETDPFTFSPAGFDRLYGLSINLGQVV
jgi:hypothetical protein